MGIALLRAYGPGASPLRSEDERLLTGLARYAENLARTDAFQAVFLRSPHAHAEILGIDVSAALEMDGVSAVFTGADLLAAGIQALPFHAVVNREDGAPMQPPPRYPLAVERVRFVGEAVAMVVAAKRLAAIRATEAIVVEYQPLAAVAGVRAAHDLMAPQLTDGAPRNVVGIMRIGSAEKTDAAFARAHHVTRLRLTNQRLSANPMENRSSIARFDAETNRLALQTGNQAPHMARDHYAYVLGIPATQLQIKVDDIGGGFGMKLTAYPEDSALLFAARQLKTDVQWKADRTEAFQSDMHGRDHDTDAEMAFDRDGRILGVRLRVLANMGAYLSFFGITVATGSGNRVVSSVYDIPAMDVEVRAILSNTVPVGPYRGAGRPETIYRMERLLDVAAAELGMDPVAIRRINLIPAEKIPYTATSGQIYESGNFPRVLDAALKVADWDGFTKRREAAEAQGLLYGRGICCHIDTTSGVRPFEEVRLTADSTGRITIYSGTQAMGQGIATVYASLVAEKLGLPIENVDIIQGDTDRVADGVGSYGSRSLFIGGSAVVHAVDALIQQLTDALARHFGSNSGDIDFTDGFFRVGAQSISAAEALRQVGSIEASGRHESKFVFPNGCYIAEVEVDPKTGVTQVVRFSGVDDVGTVIHPVIVHGQVQGSIAQGIAQALYEEIVYDVEGQLLSASFMDYAVPRADVLPRFKIDTDQTSPSPTNPLGAKGAGEAGCLGAPPAVVSAVIDAIRASGVRHIDMPLTSEKVWRALNGHKARH